VTEEYEPAGPVIRDKRRIDPETGQVREPRTAAAPSPPEADGAGATPAAGGGDTAAALAERTADLQRLQAEYLNYKRRVDRDRETARQSTIGAVLASLLPVLDDIGRAREHGELSGGFKAVAESLERTVTGFGLQSFGEPGDPFDPRIHEALMHSYSDDVTEPVCQLVLQVGYRHGERILRPARVAVAEPPAAADAHTAAPSDLSDADGPIDRLTSDESAEERGGEGAGEAGSAAEPTAAG
jgi:molecular chaperone GrpE